VRRQKTYGELDSSARPAQGLVANTRPYDWVSPSRDRLAFTLLQAVSIKNAGRLDGRVWSAMMKDSFGRLMDSGTAGEVARQCAEDCRVREVGT